MHREPKDRSEYERHIGPRIAFNQPVNRILISGPTLNLRMPTADPELFRLVKRFCEQQIEQRAPSDDHLRLTREALLRCLQRGDVSPCLVAAELDLPPGGLHRLLKEHGTSFQRLFDETRRFVAERYLFESSLPLSEIARLGYSELSAFRRAARRWFGCSARDLRRDPTRRT
jgi:AraC-like DNA-binding protein